MKIACLAWGSLVWDPRTLPHVAPFREDGPPLPIEFSRVSLDGRVTLVVDLGAPLLQTFWVPLEVGSLDEAIGALGIREKIVSDRRGEWVGSHSLGGAPVANGLMPGIDGWLSERSLDALVWTALPTRTPEGEEALPPLEVLVAHLESLSDESLARAEQYVRRTPRSIRTPHRARFESIFGWHPTDGEPESEQT